MKPSQSVMEARFGTPSVSKENTEGQGLLPSVLRPYVYDCVRTPQIPIQIANWLVMIVFCFVTEERIVIS